MVTGSLTVRMGLAPIVSVKLPVAIGINNDKLLTVTVTVTASEHVNRGLTESSIKIMCKETHQSRTKVYHPL